MNEMVLEETMSEEQRGQDPDQLMDSNELAELLGVSRSWVEKQRSMWPDNLPPHLKIGRLVRYRWATVQEWLRKREGYTN
ncbi:helix-turn-helix transcriptional regulator [Thioalkalivibrio sp.]|uniref:helix-turn-helix transcriptional regulator n=1 Tax=Thioalkalivibrio sp. TaxID=2093813 RepID=UPI0035630A08